VRSCGSRVSAQQRKVRKPIDGKLVDLHVQRDLPLRDWGQQPTGRDMRQSFSRKHAGLARKLMLLAFFSPLLLAFPGRVQAAGAAGATTVRDITLRLEMDGK